MSIYFLCWCCKNGQLYNNESTSGLNSLNRLVAADSWECPLCGIVKCAFDRMERIESAVASYLAKECLEPLPVVMFTTQTLIMAEER